MNVLAVLPGWGLDFSIAVVLYSSFFLTLGVLVLLGETAIVLRTLVLGRAPIARYLLLALPLGTGILTYIVAMHGWQIYSDWQYFQSIIGIHISPAFMNAVQLLKMNFTPTAIISLWQCLLLVALLALTFYLERKLLPRVKRPPLWTVVRRQRVV